MQVVDNNSYYEIGKLKWDRRQEYWCQNTESAQEYGDVFCFDVNMVIVKKTTTTTTATDGTAEGGPVRTVGTASMAVNKKSCRAVSRWI